MSHENFTFSKYEFNEADWLLKLYYLADEIEFIEEINFNPNHIKLEKLNDGRKKALNLAFRYLHLVAGISYYKAFLPRNIIIKTGDLEQNQANFLNSLYTNGLGEFAFKNKINLNGKINFPYSKGIKNKPIELNLNNDWIVPIGGGKDSILTLEIAKRVKNQKLYTFSVNSATPIEECCKLSGLDNILVSRKISPKLLEINNNLEKYNAYNGHVPITSIIAFISVATGIIYNCNTTLISNESSANVGNTMHDGVMVNHQWSKSFEAEAAIHNFIQNYITPAFNYFSLLRPLYEINIAKHFSKIKKYDDVFSSCNKNFKIIKAENQKKWCCDCDKCRFVFLILAPFMEKQRLINIFGTNLLDDKKQLQGFQELAGLSGYKPFECVGEIDESITAFYLLQNTEFANDFIVKTINEGLKNKYTREEFEGNVKKYLSYDFKNTLLNDKFKEIFSNFINNSINL